MLNGFAAIPAALCLSLTLFGLAGPAQAWGGAGHRLIGDLTYERLSPEAKAMVDRLIAAAPRQEGADVCPVASLADASVWADCVRGARLASFGYMSELHYVSAPVCEAAPIGSFCPDGNCVTEAVRRSEAILSDNTASDLTKLLALQQLAHFLQDLHQPLHVGQNADQGGNEVTITTIEGGRARNLHSLWDGDLVAVTIGHQRERVDELRTLIASREAQWRGQPIETWAREAFVHSRDYAYPQLASSPNCGEAPADGGQITTAYVEGAAPIVREQLGKAVVRLTEVLERAAAAQTDLPAR
ncbi:MULTISPECIES: S1/P1 nuclease [unclassified Brevundimonas]|uniref:S1/P1 nuclease n=1 Tax=unclassified Brevundimonas TaxID=2622653 RepID=UPI003F8E52B7